MTKKHVHFVSLGCPKNRVDTETMLAGLSHEGCTITGDADAADIVVVNTCAFVEDAKVESIDTILEMAQRKANGRLETPVVTGCLAQRYPEELAAEMPEVDHFVGTNNLDLVTEILDGRTGGRIAVGDPDRRDFDWDAPRQNSMGSHTAYLKVAEGCSNTCAFCIIPTLRGPQRSRDIASVLREASSLAAQGVKEFNLIAQDLTAWGYDLEPRQNLTMLLRELVTIDGLRWIRLMYAYPRSFPKGLVNLMASEEKIVPYLDMPLQHISDRVLKSMKRGTRSDAIRKRVQELRAVIPNACLRTTMLVGYPGETQDDFEELIDFIKEARFERLGAFAYSREEGTPSYDLENQLDPQTKAERLDRLMYEQRDIARQHNQDMVGREVDVLVERKSEESDLVWIGRTQYQAPEIDGITYLGSAPHISVGDIVLARVTQATDYDLVAEPVQ